MSNPNGRKGASWELDVRRCLQGHGLDVTRPWQEGHDDAGDCHIEGLFAGQDKNYGDVVTGLRKGLDGALKQVKIAALRWGVAFIKRRGKGAAEGYAVMRVGDWAEFVKEFVEMRYRLRSLEK